MAKPKPHRQLSLESAHVYDDAEGIAANHWCRFFFEHVFSAFCDAQFADMYQEGGRYPVSPSLLASIMVLQYMQHCSDRQAVENTIMRRDWRIALGLKRDWKGFEPTVLHYFRKRLAAHQEERLIFDTVLRAISELGLLVGRRRVRVDATKLLANAARLSRAECTQSRSGRCLSISSSYEQLLLDRERAADPRFRELYRLRAAVEATISEAVHCCGLRRSRYRTKRRRALHAWLALAALNVRRLLRCLALGVGQAGALSCAFSALLRAALHSLQGLSGRILRPPPVSPENRRHLLPTAA